MCSAAYRFLHQITRTPSHERLVNEMKAHTNAEQARNAIHKRGEAV